MNIYYVPAYYKMNVRNCIKRSKIYVTKFSFNSKEENESMAEASGELESSDRKSNKWTM